MTESPSRYYARYKYLENIHRWLTHHFIESGTLDIIELKRLKKDVAEMIIELEGYSQHKEIDRILGITYMLETALYALRDAYHFNSQILEPEGDSGLDSETETESNNHVFNCNFEGKDE